MIFGLEILYLDMSWSYQDTFPNVDLSHEPRPRTTHIFEIFGLYIVFFFFFRINFIAVGSSSNEPMERPSVAETTIGFEPVYLWILIYRLTNREGIPFLKPR